MGEKNRLGEKNQSGGMKRGKRGKRGKNSITTSAFFVANILIFLPPAF
jgi:hypothetical protein